MRNILLLPLVARCLLKYVVCLGRGCDGFCVSVCIVRRGAVGARVLEVQVFRHADVVCLCGSSQCCILHELQFVNAGRGCKRRPYGRGILQSRSHNSLQVAMSVSFCLPHPVAVSVLMICRGLCACIEMLCAVCEFWV